MSLRYTQGCSCSVFTVCATCNVISHVKYVLYLYISTPRSLCAVHNMAVFCSSLISCFPGMFAQVVSELDTNKTELLLLLLLLLLLVVTNFMQGIYKYIDKKQGIFL